jgi:fatty acid desaturase
MRPSPNPRIDPGDLRRLSQLRLAPNLVKIPLFIALMVVISAVAWVTPWWALRWTCYIALGYLWMSMVTFMHDATHGVLFRNKLLGTAFGIITMIPIFATFVSFREDHLEHHRHSRSPRDPDSFTMGKRGWVDFLLFYSYAVAGALLCPGQVFLDTVIGESGGFGFELIGRSVSERGM